MSCPNGASPLELPITNVTVSQDGKAVMRGIEVSVGTPQQVFSLGPAVVSDDLFVYNIADCGSTSNDTCIGPKGGVFNPKASSSYALTTQAQWNGTKNAQDLDTGSFIYFNDVLSYGSGEPQVGYPLFMNQPGHGSQGGLPLGQNSSFLRILFEAGQIPSQVWGMWPGSRSVFNPVDGLVVVGGYDTARVNGEWTTFPTFNKCPTCAVITNLTYEYEGGSTSLFANSSETLEVGLDPFVHGLELPQDIFDRFANASQATYNETLELLTYPVGTVGGNISVTMSNGFKTTMVASELFTRPRTYKEGVYSISDDNVTISVITNSTDAGYVASWGMPYLTMNYVSWSQFQAWQNWKSTV